MVLLVALLLTVDLSRQLGRRVRVLGARTARKNLRLVVGRFDLLLRDALLPLPRVADPFRVPRLIRRPLLPLQLILFSNLQFVVDAAHAE